MHFERFSNMGEMMMMMSDRFNLVTNRGQLLKVVEKLFDQEMDTDADRERIVDLIEICIGLTTRDSEMFMINAVMLFTRALRGAMKEDKFKEFVDCIANDKVKILLFSPPEPDKKEG